MKKPCGILVNWSFDVGMVAIRVVCRKGEKCHSSRQVLSITDGSGAEQ